MHWPQLLSMDVLRSQAGLQVLLETNQQARKYGLELTVSEAKEIVEARNQILLGFGRVEFGAELMRKLIVAFCASSFISREDYAITIIDLLEVFYYLKNEFEEEIPDDQLIRAMRAAFEGDCAGSIDLLKDRKWPDFQISGGPTRSKRCREEE